MALRTPEVLRLGRGRCANATHIPGFHLVNPGPNGSTVPDGEAPDFVHNLGIPLGALGYYRLCWGEDRVDVGELRIVGPAPISSVVLHELDATRVATCNGTCTCTLGSPCSVTEDAACRCHTLRMTSRALGLFQTLTRFGVL